MFPAAFRSKLARGIYPVISQKRAAGGNLNKNIRVEENSGLREISYWTWDFSPTSVTRILLYWILPSMALYSMMQTEFEIKNAQIGHKVRYGIIPPSSEE